MIYMMRGRSWFNVGSGRGGKEIADIQIGGPDFIHDISEMKNDA